jgi:hypothetical protein
MDLATLTASGLAAAILSFSAQAAAPSMPPGFKASTVTTADGARIHVRSGGRGLRWY